MKQTLYCWGFLCILLSISMSLVAQKVSKCKRDFVIKTEVKGSTCMANGSITVTLEGDLTELELSMTEYALRPMEGTEGTSLQFSRNNVLEGIAAGTYVVSVRTFCVEDAEVGVVTESRNVIVGGNYKPLMAELDLSKSQNSYADCATGSIVFNIKNDTGHGNLSFHLSKAPAEVQVGQIQPEKGAVSSGYTQYTLAGAYPAGDYQIDIYDDCSKATIVFTLKSLSDYPPFSLTFSRPNTFGDSHYLVQANSPSIDQNSYPDYYSYAMSGMYELALVTAGTTPTPESWLPWRYNYNLKFTLPEKYSKYYTSSSLDLYIRVKGCETSQKLHSKASLRKPYLRYSIDNKRCDAYSLNLANYTDGDGFWCYPIHIKVIEQGGVANAEFDKVYDKPAVSLSVNTLEYGKTYDIVVADAEGTDNSRGNTSTRQSFEPKFDFSSYEYKCNTFRFRVRSDYYNYNCLPIELEVTKKNIFTGLYEPFHKQIITQSNFFISFEWEYGDYNLTATFVNHLNTDGTPYQIKNNISMLPPRPSTLTMSSVTDWYSTRCLSNEEFGYIRVSADKNFAIGTRFTITEAPAGFKHLGRTLVSSYSSRNFEIGDSDYESSSTSTFVPPGIYTIRVEDECGTNLSISGNLVTGYNAKDVKYKIEEDGCDGAYILLDTQSGGYVKDKGVSKASYTNFRVIEGPNGGYETALKYYNNKLRIVSDGEYIIGTVVNRSYNTTYIRRDTIRYEKSKPVLKPSVTSAYVCAEASASLGYMIFTGQGGKAPYNYELFDANENSVGLTATGGDNERVVFNYGLAGETYIVRITDACGNSTTQKMTLADLKTQTITYSIPPTGAYCVGGTLNLNCITLGQTQYLWEKKNSAGVYEFVSNEQNPRIPNVSVEDSGVYRVTVTPEYCGEAITGELTVTVYPDLAITGVSNDQEICVAHRAAPMTCTTTGGNGLSLYQWQMSMDQTNWENVATATSHSYAPLHSRSGRYYYRLVITDDCNTVTSDVLTLNVKGCYIMVNPHLKSNTY